MGGSRICRGYIFRYTFRFALPVYNEETFVTSCLLLETRSEMGYTLIEMKKSLRSIFS